MEHLDTPRNIRILAAAGMALAVCVSTVWPTHAEASQALAKRYACVACHQPSTKMVGPSWADIKAKYGDGSTTVEQLAQSIKAGSSGKWGTMPMPAQSHIPDADLQSLAKWLLAGN
jgi:cytochrome c